MKNMTLRKLLLLAMLVAGSVPMIAISTVSLWQSTAAMNAEVNARLDVIERARQDSIERYFNGILEQNATMAGNATVIEAARDMGESFFAMKSDLSARFESVPDYEDSLLSFYTDVFAREYESRNGRAINATALLPTREAARLAQYYYISNNPNPLGGKEAMLASTDPSRYAGQHKIYHPLFTGVQQSAGYYDVFLVTPQDLTVVYSVFKELDYGTSLKDGPYRDSGLARAAQAAMTLPPGGTVLIDFDEYTPSYSAPAAFSAAPIYRKGAVIGALVFQMPIDRIESVISDVGGLGETGETIMVGLDDGLYRSSGRDVYGQKLLESTIQTDILDQARANDSGLMVSNAFDTNFLVKYSRLRIPGMNWFMVSRLGESESLAAVERLQWFITGISLLVLILVAVFALYIARNLLSHLGADPRKFVAVAAAMANGDLQPSPDDARATGAYAAIVQMRDKLREVLFEATRISAEVRVGAQEMSAGNMGLSERTEQQAANLEETASSTEQLTSTVRQNAENAQTAAELSRDTSQRADNGSEVAAQAVTAMREISSSSNEIANIIGVIDEIAFQTNLLALNAAVEAARAGEQGRGFAVVATEVRQLAGRSAEAAKEIKNLIQSSVAKVRDGTELVQTSGDQLQSIAKQVTDLNGLVGQISQACVEQSSGIDQINQALIHMDSVTQQNAALVEQAAATSESMRDQASTLAGHLGFFKLDGDSDSSGAPIVMSGDAPPASKPAPALPARKSSVKRFSLAKAKKPSEPAKASASEKPAPAVAPSLASAAPVSLERHAPAAKETKQWQSDKANTPPPIPQEAPKVEPSLQRAASGDEVWEEF